MIKGGEIVGKTAAIGFPVIYASEKLGMSLHEIPAQSVAVAKPQQSNSFLHHAFNRNTTQFISRKYTSGETEIHAHVAVE